MLVGFTQKSYAPKIGTRFMPPQAWIRAGATAALVLVGLAVLGFAGMGFASMDLANYGQHKYFLEIDPRETTDLYTTPTDVDAIDYDDLPPEAQRSFEAAVAGDERVLWSGEDAEAIRVLREHNVIRYRGQAYPYGLGHADVAWTSQAVIVTLIAIVGAALIWSGGHPLVRRYRSE